MTQEALKHLKAITEAFGPDAGIELDQKAWAKLHTAIKEALAQPEQEPDDIASILACRDMLDAQPVPPCTEQEPWCMKMNGCKTKCEDCPDEPPQRTEQDGQCKRCTDGCPACDATKLQKESHDLL